MNKYLANIFISYYKIPQEEWVFRIEKFKSLNINWYNNPTFGSIGFGCQGIFDTDDKTEAMKIANMIETSIGGVIVVLSLIDVDPITFPIGRCIGTSERDNGLISSSMGKVGPAMEIDMGDYHDALSDCKYTIKILENMIKLLKDNRDLDISKYHNERVSKIRNKR